MKTYADLVNEWGAILLSEDLTEHRKAKGLKKYQVNYKSVAKWRERNKIPQRYWKDIVELAPSRKVRVTLNKLAKMAIQ